MRVVEGQGSPVQKWNAIRPILERIDKVESSDIFPYGRQQGRSGEISGAG
jgi:hypothetical protein